MEVGANPRRRESGDPEGFTLIELLVVMAIIMVLASILFPAFSRARSVAQQISCASNLRQCGMALRMYQDDWEDKFPAQDLFQLAGFYGAASPRMMTGPESAVWVGQLYPYLKSNLVLRCKTANESAVDTLNGVPIGMGINLRLTYYSHPGGG